MLSKLMSGISVPLTHRDLEMWEPEKKLRYALCFSGQYKLFRGETNL